jgi:hypothetical protein
MWFRESTALCTASSVCFPIIGFYPLTRENSLTTSKVFLLARLPPLSSFLTRTRTSNKLKNKVRAIGGSLRSQSRVIGDDTKRLEQREI